MLSLSRYPIALCCVATALLAVGCRNQDSHVRRPHSGMSYPSYPTPASPSMQGPSLQPSIPELPPAPPLPTAPPPPQANHYRWGGPQVVSEPVESQQKLMPYAEQPPRMIDRIGASFRSAFTREDSAIAAVEPSAQPAVMQAEVIANTAHSGSAPAAPNLGIPEFQANVSQQFQSVIVENGPYIADVAQQSIIEPPAWNAAASLDVHREQTLPLWPHRRSVALDAVGSDVR